VPTRPARTSRILRVIAAASVALGISTAAAGCTSTPSASDARDYVIAQMSARASAGESIDIERTLGDLVPNHRFSVEGQKPAPLSAGIVFGRITKVSPGAAYTVDPADDTRTIRLAYDDETAIWRVAVLTVTTDTRVGGVSQKTIKVGYVIDGAADPETMVTGLKALDRVALVLNAPGKFEFDRSLYSVRQSGALLGLVATDGDISFPALGVEEKAFLSDVDSVDDVVSEDATSAPVVTVELDGASIERSDEGQ
jgi:hypothetical protein